MPCIVQGKVRYGMALNCTVLYCQQVSRSTCVCQNTQQVTNERVFLYGLEKTMREFSAYVAFNASSHLCFRIGFLKSVFVYGMCMYACI